MKIEEVIEKLKTDSIISRKEYEDIVGIFGLSEKVNSTVKLNSIVETKFWYFDDFELEK